MDEILPPPPSTPVTHPEVVYDQDTFTLHRVAAQVHPEPNLIDGYPATTYVPNGPVPNGPYILPKGSYYIRNGPLITMGGPHSANEGGQDPAGGIPESPPLLTTFGRPPSISPVPTISGVPVQQPGILVPMRNRPLDPRVEELRGRRSPKAFAPAATIGRNGFCRPSRRVTFLVDPVPEVDEDDEEDEELRSLHHDDDDDLDDVDDEQHKMRLQEVDGAKSPKPQVNNSISPRPDTRVRFLIDPIEPRQRTYSVVTGSSRGDMSRCGRGPGLSSLCSQSSSLGVGGVGGAHVGAHKHIAGASSACSSSSASRAGSAGSLEGVGVGVPSLEGEVGCSDCAALYPITDEALLHNLHARYKRDQIYTYAGTGLISVNPYRRLALYTAEVIHAYRSACVFQLPPHIYAVADAAHRGVWERNSDQIVVVTGESGSGKTEAAKLVLQYLAAITPRAPNQANERLLQSNPVLEAFGNARTRRNDNSSRFGKYTEIEFDHKGDPLGGTITHYLLEKSRVTTQAPGERNFHIFYQILAGADIQTLKMLKLQRNLDHYSILKSTRHSPSETLDDRTEFNITKRALDALGVSLEEQLDLLKIVASVLKLGNLTFTSVNNIDGTEGCSNENEYELHEVCELLSCDVSTLAGALQTRTVETRGETVVAELSAMEATRTRDALCRALFNRLVTWVVSRINEAIRVKTMGRRRVLGILDIFGFEILETNSFEQLIINFCNEKLHQVLTEITLKETQEDYLREGLDWTPIDIPMNNAVVDLLEQRQTGVLAVIEEVSLRVGGGKDALLQQLSFSCGGHSLFDIKGGRHAHSDNNIPADSFRIRHYAGSVTYSVHGFIEKNCDSLHRDLTRAMYRCNHSIIKDLFPEGNPRRTTLKRPASVGTQVLISVSALLRTIRSKTPHLISCVKPNELKQPRILESALVLHQIKYLGLVEQARVQSEGWSYRATHDAFLNRYGMLSLHTWPVWRGAPLEGCALLLADLPLTPQQYTFGRNKVYIKSQRAVSGLEEFRRERLEDLAVLVQKTYRGWRQQQKYRMMKAAQITLATAWRSWKAKKYTLKKTDPEAAKDARLSVKGWKFFILAREEYRELKHRRKVEWASLIIQRAYINFQRWKFLMVLLSDQPSDSPADCSWPPCPHSLAELSLLLRRLHHKWRCHRYRLQFDQTARNRMREKVTASIIFKDRKASYTKSVSHPFLGDYVRLRQNAQWKKLAAETNDQYVVFADMVNKITRSAGKFVPILLAVSTNSLLVLDQRTLQVKYRIPALDIQRISLSPYLDDIAVLHIKPPTPTADLSGSQNLNPGCLFGSDEVKRKGDLVLQTGHVIEVVTKLFLVVQNATGKPPDVNISTEFDANFGQNSVLFTFKTAGLAEVAPGQIRIMRRHNRMEVML
ncbi:unconventional myosin-Ia-like [Macrobrachium rosenbergii]|uniref:unconventional myosin-Ia-like n=1 Tax=Macrobrachium rosenbergii TaxID=79674 RepID=UPI0034D639A9